MLENNVEYENNLNNINHENEEFMLVARPVIESALPQEVVAMEDGHMGRRRIISARMVGDREGQIAHEEYPQVQRRNGRWQRFGDRIRETRRRLRETFGCRSID